MTHIQPGVSSVLIAGTVVRKGLGGTLSLGYCDFHRARVNSSETDGPSRGKRGSSPLGRMKLFDENAAVTWLGAGRRQ